MKAREDVRTLDMFCGSGGLSLGARAAIEALRFRHNALGAWDIDEQALSVHARNFGTGTTRVANLASCVDFHVYGRGDEAELAFPPEILDSRLGQFVGKVDLVLAGPPCQGHSNLNNHTRRSDPRNGLYLAAVAAIIALRARMVVIENVPDVLKDRATVVLTARRILEASGYMVSTAILSASELCCAQTRRRHFLIASLKPHTPISEVAEQLSRPEMTLRHAIGDLSSLRPQSFMDAVPVLSEENQARIDFLFKRKIYDLPNRNRPDCHKNGHTYPSVYGRLQWDRPAQTITTGFMSPGQGRYIHPAKRRVLTPREAARIQGFPDWFIFAPNGEVPSRALLAKWIGDAVPSQLGYVATLSALSAL